MNTILNEISTFGGKEPNYWVSFLAKTTMFLTVAVVSGGLIQKWVDWLQEREVLGTNEFVYLLLQLYLGSTYIYLLHQFFAKFTSDFQLTLAGMYFTTFFFIVQPRLGDVQKMILKKKI